MCYNRADLSNWTNQKHNSSDHVKLFWSSWVQCMCSLSNMLSSLCYCFVCYVSKLYSNRPSAAIPYHRQILLGESYRHASNVLLNRCDSYLRCTSVSANFPTQTSLVFIIQPKWPDTSISFVACKHFRSVTLDRSFTLHVVHGILKVSTTSEMLCSNYN